MARQRLTPQESAYLRSTRKDRMMSNLLTSKYGISMGHSTQNTGPMIPGAVAKIVLHTTEGDGIDGAFQTLVNNDDRPHFLLDPISGKCIQMVPMGQYSKALEHPSNTPETNRAGCIQIEMVGHASETQHWSSHMYHMIGALCVQISQHTPVLPIADKDFKGIDSSRVAPDHWLTAHGYFGHCNVPNNSHWDPGHFDIQHLFDSMASIR